MKTADIIIGLGFGDEGKGITTDFLAAPESRCCGHQVFWRAAGGTHGYDR
ncbi:hypothetical protein [Chryseobacterium camelliae]|uniref:Adenylosuccinate synthase n=1 Tax=Chryseobacterium camelliae TaxID=1265445 RepID=A0ABU0TMF9_9FLAO|nr:hypothetical protein [Chryseobacterium camelliae]MDQ1098229.1 adenylosuccinate synthase [Chryseobacterium camelliae]